MADHASTQKIHGHCALCIARCGTIATVEGGRFTRLDPDPSHPTGHAICAKGRAAPELVYHPERLTRPLRRTRPKGDADPGWVPISWDEALDLPPPPCSGSGDSMAQRRLPSAASGSTTAIGNSAPFVQRLTNAFGTPNLLAARRVRLGARLCHPIHVRRWQRRDRRRRGRDGRHRPTADA